jgi:phage baseplate assembly protein W
MSRDGGRLATDIASPWAIDAEGRSARADFERHVRQLIEQLLFTVPGERVNRPSFGSGLLQTVFAPNHDELSATLQVLARATLTQWLGDLIEVEAVDVEHRDSTLEVTVQYVVRRTRERQVAQFAREA